MFLIRRARLEDVGTLLKLARMVHFINLPADKDIITDKIMRSRESFLAAAEAAGVRRDGRKRGGTGHESRKEQAKEVVARNAGSAAEGLAALTKLSHQFMFVLEEIGGDGGEKGGVLGTSQIISKMGGPGYPNVSLQLSRKEMFSSTLQVGATHTVAKLVLDETGPTEIGGLILQPSYRSHRLKLGRFLSLVRFHFMGLHREMFSDHVLAEMMGPLTPDGRNTLWEYLGRRFINLTYAEADRFCQYSKEFMTSLLPREEIYISLLPPEARAVIAQVGPETLPARRLLEQLGFAYRDRIDPFDGGPHLEAQTGKIALVNQTKRSELGPALGSDIQPAEHGFVSVIDAEGDFRAVEVGYDVDTNGRVRLGRQEMKVLEAGAGMMVGVTPVRAPGVGGGVTEERTKRTQRKAEGTEEVKVEGPDGKAGRKSPRGGQSSPVGTGEGVGA